MTSFVDIRVAREACRSLFSLGRNGTVSKKRQGEIV